MNSLFDDFVLKARDICDTAARVTGDLYEISKYKYECLKLNGEIKKLYEQLGSAVYSMVKYKYGNDELIEALTEEIDEHQERLEKLTELLARMQKAEICPVCGAKNEPQNRYCAKCGFQLHKDAAGSEEE